MFHNLCSYVFFTLYTKKMWVSGIKENRLVGDDKLNSKVK